MERKNAWKSYNNKANKELKSSVEIRNHISWYLKRLKNSNEVKEKVYKAKSICDIITILNEFKEGYHE